MRPHERYSHSAFEAIMRASREAHAYEHDPLRPEHLLLGLLETDGRAKCMLVELGVDPTALRGEIETRGGFPARKTPRSGGHTGFDAGTHAAMKAAVEEAEACGHEWVGTEHLLLGILRGNDTLAAQVLSNASVTLGAVRDLVSGRCKKGSTRRSWSFDEAFDALLHDRQPVWHIVGADRERLVAACKDYLTPARVAAHDFDNPGPGRATYVLDRLLPLDEVSLFRRLNGYERWLYTLYALFRRSPADLDSVTPERFSHGESAAVEAAWVDTRASDDDLLGWAAECERRGWPGSEHQGLANVLAAIEYGRRTPDPNRIAAYLAEARRAEAPVLLHTAMRLVADSVPRTSAPKDGLADRLREAAFEKLADQATAWMTSPPVATTPVVEFPTTLPPDTDLWESHFARTLWLAQQGPADADRLLEAYRRNAAWRLAEIVPRDRPGIWERAFATNPYSSTRILDAFCRWCTAEHRHRLVPHFAHEDIGWAATALERYLALARDDEAAELADDQARPAWQVALIDRWVHAPAELRPRPSRDRYPWEITAWDYREFDPFDVRNR